MQISRRLVLTGVVTIPLFACNLSENSQIVTELENPIGNTPTPSEKNWIGFFAEIEKTLISQVEKCIGNSSEFDVELTEIKEHHQAHLKLISQESFGQEEITKSALGAGTFSELANLRTQHARSINLVKNSLAQIKDPQLITVLTQIAACDSQVVNKLADLMTQVAVTNPLSEVKSG